MSLLPRRLPVLGLAALPLTLIAGALAAPAAVADPPPRSVLADTKPDFATPANDKGKVADGTTVDLHVYLGVNDPGDLEDAAKAASDPKDAQHGKYLTPDQVKQRFQLDGPHMAAVDAWLSGAGMTSTAPNWRYLDVKGTAAQFSQAFGVELHTYANGAETDIAPNADLTVPTSLAEQVLDVSGHVIDVTGLMDPKPPTGAVHTAHTGNAASAGHAGAPAADDTCSESWGATPASTLPNVDGAAAPYEQCGYNSAQLRAMYGLTDTSQTGKGQTVAVLGTPPATLAADVKAWSPNAGVNAPASGQLNIMPALDGTGLPDPNEAPEADALLAYQDTTLAVESVHALAPDATIAVVAPSDAANGSLADSLIQIEDLKIANLVTGQALDNVGPTEQNVDDQLLAEGALEGIGFAFPSGDDGKLAYPASDPWATAVGGVAAATGADGATLWQTGWADLGAPLSADKKSWGTAAPLYGAGGGRDDGFDQPWYQQNVVPDTLAKAADGTAKRVGADIAMLADPVTGVFVGGTAYDAAGKAYTEASTGGTAGASALFVAFEAVAQQVSGKTIGFANPALYAAVGTGALRDVVAYQDKAGHYPVAVTIGGNGNPELVTVGGAPASDPNAGTGPAAGPGYDETTGLGLPTNQFARALR